MWHSFHYAADYTEPIIARLSVLRLGCTEEELNWAEDPGVGTLLATRVAAQNTDMLREFFATGRGARKVRLVPRGVNRIDCRSDCSRAESEA